MRLWPNLRVTGAGGCPVRLADLGTVADSASDLQSISRYDGQPVVGFIVLRSRGASEVQVFDRMDERLPEIERQHPEIRVTEIGSTVEFIRGMHESSIHALIEGALLACLVVFLILRDGRATLIAAAAIPRNRRADRGLRRDDGRLRHSHAVARHPHLRRAGGAVPRFLPAHHHHDGAAALDRRRLSFGSSPPTSRSRSSPSSAF